MKRLPCQLPKVYRPGEIPDGEWFSISRKENGVHAIFVDGKLFTREKRALNGVNYIIEECWLLSSALGGTASSPFVIEGELIFNDDTMSDFDRFAKTASIVNRRKEKPGLILKLFDAITEEEYYSHEDNVDKYSFRKQRMLSAYEAIKDDLKYISPVTFLYEGYDQEEIEKCFKYSESKKWEGIVINRDVPYTRSKNSGAMKYKHINTVDLPIVDFKPGTGKFKGSLGALIVSYKGNTVRVGTGMSYEFREWVWAHRPELIGRVVEVRFQTPTKNSVTGDESLQFPCFVCLRDKGKEVNEDG